MNNIQSDNHFQKNASTFLIYGLAGGGIGIVLYASISPAQFLSLCGVAMMIAGASFGGGALLGFLFGIPMSVQPVTLTYQQTTNPPGENSSVPESQSEAIGLKSELEAISSARRYRGNTNLEDISNWLTKMLLGVGLTQIPAIVEAIRNYAEFAAPGLGGEPGGKVFATSILVYFLICGFIAGYMWARLNLARMFTEADNALERKISEQKQQISGLLKLYMDLLFTLEMHKKDGGIPCELKPYGKENNWMPLAVFKDKIAAMYRKYDNGIVIAMGHAFVLGHEPNNSNIEDNNNEEYTDSNNENNEEYNNGNNEESIDSNEENRMNYEGIIDYADIVTTIFNEILNPYTNKRRERRVIVSTGHGETHTVDELSLFRLDNLKAVLECSGYTVEDIKKPINNSELNKGDILIVGNACVNLEDNEIEAVRNFVSKGGSLFAVGIAWAWESKDKQDLNRITYPMNKLVKPYGMRFLPVTISL